MIRKELEDIMINNRDSNFRIKEFLLGTEAYFLLLREYREIGAHLPAPGDIFYFYGIPVRENPSAEPCEIGFSLEVPVPPWKLVPPSDLTQPRGWGC